MTLDTVEYTSGSRGCGPGTGTEFLLLENLGSKSVVKDLGRVSRPRSLRP